MHGRSNCIRLIASVPRKPTKSSLGMSEDNNVVFAFSTKEDRDQFLTLLKPRLVPAPTALVRVHLGWQTNEPAKAESGTTPPSKALAADVMQQPTVATWDLADDIEEIVQQSRRSLESNNQADFYPESPSIAAEEAKSREANGSNSSSAAVHTVPPV